MSITVSQVCTKILDVAGSVNLKQTPGAPILKKGGGGGEL